MVRPRRARESSSSPGRRTAPFPRGRRPRAARVSSSDGASGKSEAVCPSGPSPSSCNSGTPSTRRSASKRRGCLLDPPSPSSQAKNRGTRGESREHRLLEKAHVRSLVIVGDVAIVAEPHRRAAPVRLERSRALVGQAWRRATGEPKRAPRPHSRDDELGSALGRCGVVGLDDEVEAHRRILRPCSQDWMLTVGLPDGSTSIVRSAYDAFARRDLDGALAPFSHRGRLASGAGPSARRRLSRHRGGACRRVRPARPDWWSVFDATPEELIDGGENIVALGRYTGEARQTGRALDVPFAHVWTFSRLGRPIRPVRRHRRLERGAGSKPRWLTTC